MRPDAFCIGEERSHYSIAACQTPLASDSLTHSIQGLFVGCKSLRGLAPQSIADLLEPVALEVAFVHSTISLERIVDHICNQNCVRIDLLEPKSWNSSAAKYLHTTSQESRHICFNFPIHRELYYIV